MSGLVIMYDADCGFCRWSIARILGWDRRRVLRPIEIQSAEGDRLLCDMPADRRLASWHLARPDGHVFSGGRVLVPLLRALPGGAPLAAIARPLQPLVDRAYVWVAGRRSWWGRVIPSQSKVRADRRIAERRIATEPR